MRLRLACSLALCAVAAVPAAAGADTDWKQVSSVGEGRGASPPLELAHDGTAVVGTWIVRNGNLYDLETVRLTPTRSDEVAGLVRARPPAFAGWDFLDAAPVLNVNGAAQVVVTGQKGANVASPSGTNFAPLLPDGNVGTPVNVSPATTDMLEAIQAAGAPTGVLWAGNYGSTLYAYASATAPYQITGNVIPGCCGYDPRLGVDASGRVWIAFYSNATNSIGVWMYQVDPATGAPVAGTAVMAPQSATPDNNNAYGVGFACAAVCRVAYEETDAIGLGTGRVVTWAPGEPAPTVAGGSVGGRIGTPTIAYRPDGRLWVAWLDTTTERVVATLGKGPNAARGAGGTRIDAGRPPLPADNPFLKGLESIAVGNDVLLNLSVPAGGTNTAQWVNLVLEPGAIDTSGIPNPVVTPRSPGGRIVYPGTVTPVELGPNRCVRVKPVADKPARIWAQIFSGRKNGTPVSTRVAFRFTAPGAKSKCMTLQKKPAGFYTGKFFRIKFEVRTGANSKPAEKHRPPWRTQPRIIINA